MRKSMFTVFALFVCWCLPAQQTMNNDVVVKMVKAGLSDDVIVTAINASPGTYDTTVNGLIALKQAGVSDRVLSAVILKASGTVRPSSEPQPSAAPTNDAEPVTGATPGVESVAAKAAVPMGARVMIAPMGGFETYFAAAVKKKGVPITLTLEKNSAQYFVVSNQTDWQGFFGEGAAGYWTVRSTRGNEASIMLVDAKTKDVVWAYEVQKNSGDGGLLFNAIFRGQQSEAEACAKHLKEYIEEGK